MPSHAHLRVEFIRGAISLCFLQHPDDDLVSYFLNLKFNK